MDESTCSSRQAWWRRWFGTRSERFAARMLKRLGYRILSRNYRCNLGELDLVAFDQGCLVFVEVRSTEKADLARPAISVDVAKQRRLTALAMHYLKRYSLNGRAARFDVLTISWPAGARKPEFTHYQNAFDAVGTF